jgi:hypothetical protein
MVVALLEIKQVVSYEAVWIYILMIYKEACRSYDRSFLF